MKKVTILSLFLIIFGYSSSYGQYCLPTHAATNCSYPTQFSSTTIGTFTKNNYTCVNVGRDTSGLALGAIQTFYTGKTYTCNWTSTYQQKHGVWIDFNNDKDFLDAGEFLAASTANTNAFNGTITIPNNAGTGIKRFRLRGGFVASGPNPNFIQTSVCNNVYAWGSMVDYLVRIEKTTARDLAVTSVSNINSDCGLGNIRISVNGFNNGTGSIPNGDSLVFGYKVNGGATIRESRIQSGALVPNAAFNFTFATPVNASTAGIYTVKVFNMTKNDSSALNDTVTITFENEPVVKTFPWVEDFESSPSLPQYWKNATNDGAHDWWLNVGSTPSINTGPDYDHTKGPSSYSGRYVYVEDGSGAVAQDHDSVNLLTPCIDISSLSSPKLEFWVHHQDTTNRTNRLFIDIMRNGRWFNNIQTPTTGIVKHGNYWKKYTIDLSSYKGIVKIKFRVNCRNFAISNDIAIDDVKIYNEFCTDASLQAIVSPAGGSCGDSNTKVTVVVKNAGKCNLTNIPLSLKFDYWMFGQQTVTLIDTIKRTILPGATDTFTLNQTINSFFGITYTVNGGTRMPGDSANFNDSLKNFKIGVSAGMETPRVKTNFACAPASVKMFIDSFYGYPVLWYDNPNGNPIFMGDTFTTPVLSYDKTYYAQLTSANLINIGEKSKNNTTTNTSYNTFTSGLIFDALSPFRLDSLSFYPFSNGIVRVNLEDSTGRVLQTASFTVIGSAAAPERRVALFFNIPVGKNYRITARNSTVTGLIGGNGSGYSYTASGIITIKGNNYTGFPAAPNRYYFFYNWKITAGGCYSKLSPIKAGILKGVQGTGLDTAQNFKGSKSLGSISQPDTIPSLETSVYVLLNPTGLTGADFGTKWNVNKLEIKSISGTNFTDTATTAPNSSQLGTLYLSPKANWADSIIVVRIGVTAVGQCDSELVRYIYISPKPKADFTFNAGCAGLPVSFFNNSSIVRGSLTYEWSFGDNTFSQSANPPKVYTNGGSYKVTLKAISGGGTFDTISKIVFVKYKPVVKFKPFENCLGEVSNFNDSSYIASGSIAGYLWLFSDGGQSFSSKPQKTFTSPVTYQVKLILTSDQVCRDSATENITINPLPTPSFSAPTACQADSIKFLNKSLISSGTIRYKWDLGNGDKSTSESFNHYYNQAGTFMVKLVATSDKGCKDSTTNSVTVLPQPNGNFTVSGNIAKATFKAEDSTAKDYVWDFGDGYSAKKNPSTHTYDTAGTYTVSLTVSNTQGCITTKQMVVKIDENVGIGEVSILGNSLKLYPNPIANNNLNIEFSLSESAPVSIQIYTVQGSLIEAVMNNQVLESGNFKKVIQLSNHLYANGVYKVLITVKNQSITKEIMILKD